MPKSLKKRERDSNMELLRILAMVLVMIVHANFRALPVPTQMETINFTLSSLLRFNTESISIVCVDVFVLLSGWYGIRFRWERLGELLFQIVFFVAIITIATANFTQKHIHLYTLLLLDKWDYWFVKAYVCLYFFSPVLNSFIQNTSKKKFKNFLLIYFLFQTVYGWISQGAAWFNRGYSSISFMGLYKK